MTALQEHISPSTGTKLAANATNNRESLGAYRTSSTDKSGAEEGHIELVESPGASQDVAPLGGQAQKAVNKERAKLGWTPWKREKKMKQTEDGVGEPLERVRSNEELLRDEDDDRVNAGRIGRGGIQRHDERDGTRGDAGPVVYKVYKRRWFGLAQLVLLNVVVSWDVSTIQLHIIPSITLNYTQTGLDHGDNG